MKKKVVLLGIDGADWAFLDEWLDEGYMPNLAGLVKNGVRAPLTTSLPLNSAASWTSIITGRSPGGHGVFGFTCDTEGGYQRRPVSSEDIGAATLWEIVNAAGDPAGIINCPITYPPPKLDGFLVSGILIPHNDLWAHPPKLEKKLKNIFGPYFVDIPWAWVDEAVSGEREKFIADLNMMTRKQEEVALWCMTERRWRVLGIFFTGTDRIMHRLTHHSDPRHPMYTPEAAKCCKDEIRKYFSLIDDVIGKILDKAGDAAVIVVSDHGFGSLYYRFNLRAWLARKGYLVEGKTDASIKVDEALTGIDFRKSKAYPATLSVSGIWINLEGRNPAGIVSSTQYEKTRERIIRELEEFTTENSGRPVKRALRREDVIAGPFARYAPDILIEPNDLFIIDDASSDALTDISKRETGAHRPTGIFVASGPQNKQGVTLSTLRTVDVLPTLLATAGLPVPEDLEGEVAVDVFKEVPDIKRRPPVIPKRVKKYRAQDEDEKRRDQLKGLGYI